MIAANVIRLLSMCLCLLSATGLSQRQAFFSSSPEHTVGIDGGFGGSTHGVELMTGVFYGVGPLIAGVSYAVTAFDDEGRQRHTWCFSPGVQARASRIRFRGAARLSYVTGRWYLLPDGLTRRESLGLGAEVTAFVPVTNRTYVGVQVGRDLQKQRTITFGRVMISVVWNPRAR